MQPAMSASSSTSYSTACNRLGASGTSGKAFYGLLWGGISGVHYAISATNEIWGDTPGLTTYLR